MTKKSVPFFNYKALFAEHETAFTDIFQDVGHRGAYIMQSDLRDFEQRLAKYSGARHAVGVANATDGLQMLLMAGGLQAGDEVIFCSHTMVATASAIHFAGGIPVPVDAGADHLIDCSAVEAAITDKTTAIVVTQLNGRCANMFDLMSLAERHGLRVYEDSAQALGAKFDGKMAGTFDMGGCISFYPAKILGCFGDGGAVLCNDDAVYEQLLLLRDHGRAEDGDVKLWGFNSRLDNLQAAILNYMFDEYETIIQRRRQIASLYHDALGQVAELSLPPAPTESGPHFDVFQNFEIEADRRDELIAYLKEHGVGTLQQWGGKAVHQFPHLGFTQSLSYTDELMARMVMIPLNMSMSDDDVNYVCEKILAFYNEC